MVSLLAIYEILKLTIFNSGLRTSEAKLGKRIMWLDANGEECSVENMCLSYYCHEGWKGFHTEGGILRTIVRSCMFVINLEFFCAYSDYLSLLICFGIYFFCQFLLPSRLHCRLLQQTYLLRHSI